MIELFTKDNCSYCETAKQLLRLHKKEFKEYKLNEDFTREVLLSKYPNSKTYPVVVVDGFNIGGCDQLQLFLKEEIEDNRKFLLEG